MRAPFKLACLLLLAPFLASCLGPARQLISSTDEVGAGEAVVVGKVVLTPPLDKNEQKLGLIGSDSFKNNLFLLAGDQWRDLEIPLTGDDYKGRIEAPLGKTFFALSDAHPFYILGGVLILEVSGGGTNNLYFPGGFKVGLQANDKAVYIGTIHYYRNEFSQITKLVVEDDYAQAQALYAKNFGGRSLRKALLTRVQK